MNSLGVSISNAELNYPSPSICPIRQYIQHLIKDSDPGGASEAQKPDGGSHLLELLERT